MGATIYPIHSSSLALLLHLNFLFSVHMISGLCVVSNAYVLIHYLILLTQCKCLSFCFGNYLDFSVYLRIS